MDSFYLIVVAIAVFLLILCLTGVGILMGYQNANLIFPPSASTCPDGWTTVANSCTIPAGKYSSRLKPGTSTNYDGYTQAANPADTDGNRGSFDFSNWAICDKKKWANQFNINWDGVSNYTKC